MRESASGPEKVRCPPRGVSIAPEGTVSAFVMHLERHVELDIRIERPAETLDHRCCAGRVALPETLACAFQVLCDGRGHRVAI